MLGARYPDPASEHLDKDSVRAPNPEQVEEGRFVRTEQRKQLVGDEVRRPLDDEVGAIRTEVDVRCG
jgi:hypothetical protein